MNRNSIHDIKPSAKLRRLRGNNYSEAEENKDYFDNKKTSRRQRREYDDPYVYEKRGGGGAMWIIAVACILGLVFALSFLFSSATITITPRTGKIEINKTLVANKVARSGSLSFEVVTLSGEEKIYQESLEKKYVEERAKGQVTIFNNHSNAPQNLLIDTRLESSDGKIYKTEKAVTVPGTRISGGQTIPGSVTVEVYADDFGEEYNKGVDEEFKIFGFKGTSKENTFYAKSIKDIEGGFKGDKLVMPDMDKDFEGSSLEEKLKSKLIEDIKRELPEDFIMYDNLVFFDSVGTDFVESSDGFEVIQKGEISAFIFRKEDLTKELVKDLIADFDNSPVYIEDIENISVNLISDKLDKDIDSMSVTFGGDTKIVWMVDENNLKTSLSGVKERKFESILINFKNIEKAELSIKPFWKSVIPEEVDKIKVVNTITQN